MEYQIDATGKKIGRLASEIAMILQGKKSPEYAPNKVGGDRVLVSNVAKLSIDPKKATQKRYYRHTGYMGHLKSKTLNQVFAQDPRKVLREAVRKMLPKNFLNQKRLNNLTFTNGK